MNATACGIIIALTLSLAPLNGLAQPAPPPTLAHAVLDLEAAALTVAPSDHAFVDEIIAAVRAQAPATPTDRASAVAALAIVDKALVDRNIIYPGTGLIEYLHEGLTPRSLSASEFGKALRNIHNQRRQAVMLRNKAGPFRVLDCDTASFVYLSVAEALDWPLALVEIPQHNFVRWTFADGSHLNFETMDGVERSDPYYIANWNIPATTMKPGFYMSIMGRDEVLGYVLGLRASAFAKTGEFAKAKLDLDEALQNRPLSPTPLNSRAWLYATCTPASCRDPALAVQDATQAVTVYRSANYLDTLACALAISGDIDRAIQIETEALALDPGSTDLQANLKVIRTGGPCLYEQPPAFRAAPFNRRMGNGSILFRRLDDGLSDGG